MTRKTYYYQFADGYYCYYAGRPSKEDLAWEVRQHGAIVAQRVV